MWKGEPCRLQFVLGSQVSWEEQLVSDFTLMTGDPRGVERRSKWKLKKKGGEERGGEGREGEGRGEESGTRCMDRAMAAPGTRVGNGPPQQPRWPAALHKSQGGLGLFLRGGFGTWEHPGVRDRGHTGRGVRWEGPRAAGSLLPEGRDRGRRQSAVRLHRCPVRPAPPGDSRSRWGLLDHSGLLRPLHLEANLADMRTCSGS